MHGNQHHEAFAFLEGQRKRDATYSHPLFRCARKERMARLQIERICGEKKKKLGELEGHVQFAPG